jgi:hypothetical protein
MFPRDRLGLDRKWGSRVQCGMPATAAQLSLIVNDLPQILRKRRIKDLTGADKKVILGMLAIKEMVQKSYQKQARLIQDCIRQKREAGYCGGFIYCLQYSGKKYMCDTCRKQKANPAYSRKMSEYGRIRKAEKEKSRNEG